MSDKTTDPKDDRNKPFEAKEEAPAAAELTERTWTRPAAACG
jgi:hypothetical protein